jgi:hypothetical protein
MSRALCHRNEIEFSFPLRNKPGDQRLPNSRPNPVAVFAPAGVEPGVKSVRPPLDGHHRQVIRQARIERLPERPLG